MACCTRSKGPVTALNIEHGNKKLNGIDRTNDNTPLRKTVHKFNKNFYTITAVTPSDFSLFTSSPNLVNRLLEAVATPLRHWRFDRDGCWLVDAYLSRPAAPYGRPMREPAQIQVRVTLLSPAHLAMWIFCGTHTCRILFLFNRAAQMRLVIK